MDWKVIVAGALSGAGVAAAVGALMGKIIERAVGVRLESLAEKNRLELQESIRREAAIYDRQFEAAKEVVSEAYRTRNTMRELLKCFPENPEAPINFRRHITFKNWLRHLERNRDGIYQLLSEDHSLMSDEFFGSFHAFKGEVETALGICRRCQSRPTLSVQELYEHQSRLAECLKRSEDIRVHLLRIFQSRFLATD